MGTRHQRRKITDSDPKEFETRKESRQLEPGRIPGAVPSIEAKDRGENHADKTRRWSPPSGLLPRAYHRGLMVRVARVFHEHLSWRGGGAPPWKVIPVYICATSIWTYDGNNLEALAARRTCAASAAAAAAGSRSLHGATLGTGDVLRVRATGHRNEYDAVCATLEGVKPQ
ncbi:hypothetical protein K0M31_014282 [Melipona bicolor]|uniref:Uncharacterized protein n=1 Tax=Melipona bicolor TaxID=60889 RepID=A0AA40KU74_9HYME|nr:hypothetical protein K0M31_014282 [Melipona bicolor]